MSSSGTQSVGRHSKPELALLSSETDEDGSRKLAWVNSICLMFLIAGIAGTRLAKMRDPALAPMQEAVPAILEPAPPPPVTQDQQRQEERPEEKPQAPQVVVVTPDAPSIQFSVPTVGNLVSPNPIAATPPLEPMQAPAPLHALPMRIETTGGGGERPAPPYPQIALQQGQQGSVTLSIRADGAGHALDAETKQSSGSSVLDRSAIDYVKKHWLLPRGHPGQVYETQIRYRLER
jgi:protein TonB